MKNRKMKFKKRHQELELEVIEQDLRQEQKVDGTAMTVIHNRMHLGRCCAGVLLQVDC